MSGRQRGSWKRGVVATELQQERDRRDFDQQEMFDQFMIPETQDFVNKIQDIIENDPALWRSHKYFEWEKPEGQKRWFQILNHLYFNKDHKPFFKADGYNVDYQWWFQFQGPSPIQVHNSMVLHSISSFGTEEQVKHWLTKAENLDILTCYAQTEMGHGSDVSGLQTTATFDREKDEFIIDTPCLEATKWWPGDMGRVANIALVFAKIIIPDEDGNKNAYSLAPFIVQLRDYKTHKVLPGIEVGDMGGNKFGFGKKDNGWLALHQVRVPRSHMLSKFLSVDREGNFSIEGDLRILYSTMLRTRVELACSTKYGFLVSSTIALRYSAVRRQFRNISGKQEETQLLDYQTQHMKLFPILAYMFATSYGCQYLKGIYDQLQADIQKDDFSRLPLLHHFSAGMKAVYTQEMIDQMLVARQSLGGAGYLDWSSIPNTFQNTNSTVTLEGDNTLLAHQSFNLLLKYAEQAMKGKKDFSGPFSYLNEMSTFDKLHCSASSPDHFLDLETVLTALKVRMLFQLKTLVSRKANEGLKKKKFVNEVCATEVEKAAVDHIKFITFWLFREAIRTRQFKCSNVKHHLTNLCLLFGLDILNRDTAPCFDSGFFNQPGTAYSQLVLEALKSLMKEIRPQAVNIVESVPLKDEVIQSAIGNSFGDIYETQVEWAMDSKLNHTPHGDAIPVGFYEYMKTIKAPKL